MRTTTKGAIAAAAAMPVSPHSFGPLWAQVAGWVIQLVCAAYVTIHVLTPDRPRRREVER